MTAVALQSLLWGGGGQPHTAHLLQGKRQLESLPPPAAICPYTTFCTVAHCTWPFCPSVTVPPPSLLIILSPCPISLSACALCPPLTHCNLSISLPLPPIHSVLFICSLMHSLFSIYFFLFASQRDTSGLKMRWPLLWNSEQSKDIPLIFCCYLCLRILSFSSAALVFSPVFTCMGGKVSCQIMWNTTRRYDVMFSVWALIHCTAFMGFSKMSSIMWKLLRWSQ